MTEKLKKPDHARNNAPAPGSAEEYNANHLSASAGHSLHLPDGLRARLEARTGVDLGNVQMRESDQPESIGARAFARGNVIDFAPGEFQPGTEEGEALIGHEVSHVLQQAKGQVRADSGASPVNADPALEHAADMGVQGGMESVPSMSYAASPVQGYFGINHLRRAWHKWRGHGMKDSPVEEDPADLAPMSFGDDEVYDQPLAAAGSSMATTQLRSAGSQDALPDVDYTGILPMAPVRRNLMGAHR